VVDGVNKFAIPLTIAVICEQLGIGQFNSDKIQRGVEHNDDQSEIRESAGQRDRCDL